MASHPCRGLISQLCFIKLEIYRKTLGLRTTFSTLMNTKILNFTSVYMLIVTKLFLSHFSIHFSHQSRKTYEAVARYWLFGIDDGYCSSLNMHITDHKVILNSWCHVWLKVQASKFDTVGFFARLLGISDGFYWIPMFAFWRILRFCLKEYAVL